MADTQALPGDGVADDDTAAPTSGSLKRPDADGPQHQTGAEQAAINRQDDPPA